MCVCMLINLDCIGGILGVARGSGWQNLGAYVNLGSYYIVGIPMAAVLAFVVHLRVKGLWIGLVSGAAIQSFLFALITTFTDWHKQVLSLSHFFSFFCSHHFLTTQSKF